MITITDIKNLIASHHNPALAEQDGMVYQIWEDGEITLQKSGSLLNQRNLHCIAPGIVSCIPKEYMPVVETNHGYAYIESMEIGQAVRTMMVDFAKQLI